MDGIGWVLMIVVGGIAGLIASRITKTNRSLTGNVVLGILGAIGSNAILSSVFGMHLGGLAGQLITAIIGAIAIIVIVQFLRQNRNS